LNSGKLVKRRVAGTIGKIGTHSADYISTIQIVNYVELTTGTDAPEQYDMTYHRYRKQITETVYEEIRVPGLAVTYYIKDQHTVLADNDDPILLIPLDYTITSKYPIPIKEELYARSLHLIFNSYVVQTIKWYQTSVFKYVVIIIAIILTILSKGATIKLLIAALAAGAYAAAAYIIISIIIEQYIVATLFKLFVKAVGVKIAFLAAIVAAAYGVYDALDAGSLNGAPFAQDLLSLSNGLSKAVVDNISANIAKIIEQSTEFLKFMDEQTKLLDTANELLDNSVKMNPIVIFGETPDEYYNRTIRAGNIGIIGIEAISSYVDISLTLPRLNDTIETETIES